jgi:putative flippase GtrA
MKGFNAFARRILNFEFLRFGIVGIIATAIHYGIYYLLLSVLNVNVAYTIGYVVSLCCNFYLTSRFTFRSKATVKKGVGFGLSHAINFALHMILLNVFLYLGLSEAWAPIPVYCICIPVNFLLVKFAFNRL